MKWTILHNQIFQRLETFSAIISETKICKKTTTIRIPKYSIQQLKQEGHGTYRGSLQPKQNESNVDFKQ